MGDRLLEGRAAQRAVARSSPPFDCRIVEPRLGEMMGDRLGLGIRAEQRLGGAAMQRLAPALEQALVSRVLDQRVLETIGRIWRRAFDEEKVGFGEAFEGGLQPAVSDRGYGVIIGRGYSDPGNSAEQRIRKIAPQNRAGLRDLARFAKPVEPRRERLLQGWRIACVPLSSKRRVTSSTNSGTPPVRSLTPSTTSSDCAWREEISPTMRATCARSRGASAITLWCGRKLQGERTQGAPSR